ncbi:sulfatase-like hydrolase/transferase [Arenicella sp. 4NH20-0111]|uniref:sulfatase n=1 Tax=Arenicella sp. 4NH20-0111 TaxID=3127648 RepID=UPI00310A5E26
MKPNIILITIDCWRGDHLGLSKGSPVKTPNLDSIAAQGHYFSNAYSCGGWTKVAMTSLFSSTHASMYGFTYGKMSTDRPNLAELFSENGYATAGYTTNLVCGRSGGFDRGFDVFEDLKPDPPASSGRSDNLFSKIAQKLENHRLTSWLFPSKPYYPSTSADELISKGKEWIAQEHKRPFFLWLHFMDLHWPYASSLRELSFLELNKMRSDRRKWQLVKQSRGTHDPGTKTATRWKQLYAEEVEALDSSLGELFHYLETLPLWDNTALCITNDHGEELYEHGTWAHSWNQLFDEGTRTPIIFKLPHSVDAKTHDYLVSHLDLSPTLLSLASIDVPEKMLGNNLFDTPSTPIYIEMLGHSNSYAYRLAIRDSDYHYIYDADNDSCYLFSTTPSGNSENNLYQHDCETSIKFDKLRLAHVSKGAIEMLKRSIIIGEDEFSHNLENDPLVADRLRALGYIE